MESIPPIRRRDLRGASGVRPCRVAARPPACQTTPPEPANRSDRPPAPGPPRGRPRARPATALL